MPAKKPPPKDEKPQKDRFKEAAREAEADQSGKTFEKAFTKVVKPAKPRG
jgi:hypothetical protein